MAWATATIEVRGLFRNGAVMVINGEQRLLKVGQTSPEGVKLVAADTRKAVIEVNGQRRTMTLSKQIASSFAPVEKKTTTVPRTANNQYLVTGTINGVNTEMLVDTGATAVAMSSATAQNLGIDYRNEKNKGVARTASGLVTSYRVQLATVSVGEITLRNVTAFVNEGAYPHVVLLGMSFLRHVEIRDSGGVLVLEQ
jgi:aspartyl protease family protein